jgi:ribosome maturation protein SDO1
MARMTFDKERVSMDIARLRKGSNVFEIVINPDLALDYRNNKPVDLRDILIDEKIFSDAKKGMLASENEMEKLFKTAEPLRVAEIILKQGDVHLTADYKAKLLEEKRRRIISIIQTNGVDPRTKLPHPATRINNAFEEAKVKIDEHKSAEDQIEDVLKALRPILPIKFEVKKVEIMLPAKYSGKLHSIVKGFGKILKQDWNNDGSVSAVVEVPGGLEPDFYDKLNNFTSGSVETRTLNE